MIENELKILRKVKHPNIIKLVEEYSSEHKFYLIMELLKVMLHNYFFKI
jgi:calcium/calmodulin-dependent protein kinase I